jgi:hypothetical protein
VAGWHSEEWVWVREVEQKRLGQDRVSKTLQGIDRFEDFNTLWAGHNPDISAVHLRGF